MSRKAILSLILYSTVSLFVVFVAVCVFLLPSVFSKVVALFGVVWTILGVSVFRDAQGLIRNVSEAIFSSIRYSALLMSTLLFANASFSWLWLKSLPPPYAVEVFVIDDLGYPVRDADVLLKSPSRSVREFSNEFGIANFRLTRTEAENSSIVLKTLNNTIQERVSFNENQKFSRAQIIIPKQPDKVTAKYIQFGGVDLSYIANGMVPPQFSDHYRWSYILTEPHNTLMEIFERNKKDIHEHFQNGDYYYTISFVQTDGSVKIEDIQDQPQSATRSEVGEYVPRYILTPPDQFSEIDANQNGARPWHDAALGQLGDLSVLGSMDRIQFENLYDCPQKIEDNTISLTPQFVLTKLSANEIIAVEPVDSDAYEWAMTMRDIGTTNDVALVKLNSDGRAELIFKDVEAEVLLLTNTTERSVSVSDLVYFAEGQRRELQWSPGTLQSGESIAVVTKLIIRKIPRDDAGLSYRTIGFFEGYSDRMFQYTGKCELDHAELAKLSKMEYAFHIKWPDFPFPKIAGSFEYRPFSNGWHSWLGAEQTPSEVSFETINVDGMLQIIRPSAFERGATEFGRRVGG